MKMLSEKEMKAANFVLGTMSQKLNLLLGLKALQLYQVATKKRVLTFGKGREECPIDVKNVQGLVHPYFTEEYRDTVTTVVVEMFHYFHEEQFTIREALNALEFAHETGIYNMYL